MLNNNRFNLFNILKQKINGNPFSFLGLHHSKNCSEFRVFVPNALNVRVLSKKDYSNILDLKQIDKTGLFYGRIKRINDQIFYLLEITWPKTKQILEDPYQYQFLIKEFKLDFLKNNNFSFSYQKLGAQLIKTKEVQGVLFSLWAPHAKRISIIGNFNNWDDQRYFMNKSNSGEIWEFFLPNIEENEAYQYRIVDANGNIVTKSDPYAFAQELAPKNHSIVRSLPQIKKSNKIQLDRNQFDKPISIYEVHLGSWKRHADGSFLSYRELSQQLIPYVKQMGFTHIELLPIHNHPYYPSWGYQPLGLYASTPFYGSSADLIDFIESAHQQGLNVILDWVGGHFPEDKWGLVQFDGTSLYEYADSREAIQKKWKTLIYDYSKPKVREFLKDNVIYWIERYGFDGIRMDAVTSMIYRDFNREEGEWIKNKFGGNTNLEAIDLLREINEFIHDNFKGTIIIAEEASDFKGVTSSQGLEFDYKWNMGWTTDILNFLTKDFATRNQDHEQFTIVNKYAWKENFIIPLSHDNISQEKGPLFNKIYGDRIEKFSTLRAYYALMWAYPGKKLLFMGNEFAQLEAWDPDVELSWWQLENPHDLHQGVQLLIKDLNDIYKTKPALYENDRSSETFEWIVIADKKQSIFAFIRYGKDRNLYTIIICNFSNNSFRNYRLGVHELIVFNQVLNTDNVMYGGQTQKNKKTLNAENIGCHGQPYSIVFNLPSLSTLYFEAK